MLEFSLRNHIHYSPSQGHVECCTSSAILLATEIMLSIQGKRLNLSRLFLYYMTRKLQGRLGQHGAQLKYAFQALSKYGVCTDQRWPFTPDRINKEPDSIAIYDAANYMLRSYETITMDQYKDCLVEGMPIIIGMMAGKKFWTLQGPLEEHKYKPINETDNKFVKGHALICVGYNDNINGGSWIIANSLGPKWGFRGFAAIPYECYSDIKESYVITDFSGITPRKNFPRI